MLPRGCVDAVCSGLDDLGMMLTRTIDLAIALEDTALRRIVESMANDRAESTSRGVTDAARIAKVRQHATDRLAGIPALPRP